MQKSTSNRGIGRRIARLVSIAVATAVIVVAGLLVAYQAQRDATSKRNYVEGTAFVFASAVADHMASRNTPAIRMVLRSVHRVPGVISAAVYDSDGRQLSSLGSDVVLDNSIMNGNQGLIGMITHEVMPVSVNIIKGGEKVGTLILYTDITDLQRAFINNLFMVLAASFIAAVMSVALSLPLQRRIRLPIQKLTQSIQKMRASNSYAVEMTDTIDGETGILLENFNKLISDVRLRDASLQRLAYFDPLTGLSNREHFMHVLEEQKELNAHLSVVVLNIDNVQTIIDAFGHVVGEEVQSEFATILKREISDATLLARFGRNEFALICNDDDVGSISQNFVAKIQAVLFQSINIHDLKLHLSVSAGIVRLPRDTQDTKEAMRFLDLSLSVALAQGTGRCVLFEKRFDEQVQSETEIALGLRKAVANDELCLHFQPQFEFSSNSISGFEALVRWQHPDRGFLSPGSFIPIAEKNGLIPMIGDWVLLESCRQLKCWLNKGEPLRAMSVNVSPAQILQSGFVGKVQAVLTETGVPAELLCLEITESLFLGRSLATVRHVLADLHKLGVSLAIDDFGTGYSSLSYLSSLPFDTIKIDRSFVTDCNKIVRRKEVLRSIVHMARGLGLSIVAEGAETPEELAVLRELAVDEVQGYVIARPLIAADAMTFANGIGKAAA